MIALLIAAQLAAAQPAIAPRAYIVPDRRLTPKEAAALRRCLGGGLVEAQDPSLFRRQDAVRLRNLGDLPKAHHEKAVLRMEGPCVKPEVVQYNVGR